MYLIKEIGTCLFPGLLHPAKHFLMDSMDTYLVMMVHLAGLTQGLKRNERDKQQILQWDKG